MEHAIPAPTAPSVFDGLSIIEQRGDKWQPYTLVGITDDFYNAAGSGELLTAQKAAIFLPQSLLRGTGRKRGRTSTLGTAIDLENTVALVRRPMPNHQRPVMVVEAGGRALGTYLPVGCRPKTDIIRSIDLPDGHMTALFAREVQLRLNLFKMLKHKRLMPDLPDTVAGLRPDALKV